MPRWAPSEAQGGGGWNRSPAPPGKGHPVAQAPALPSAHRPLLPPRVPASGSPADLLGTRLTPLESSLRKVLVGAAPDQRFSAPGPGPPRSPGALQ